MKRAEFPLFFGGYIQKFEFISFVERTKGYIFFLNRTRFCVAQDLFNKSDARVAYILYVFQDFESISFVERNKNDKETNIFKSQREEYIIRLRTKFFSQNIFQRVDRILSSLDIFLITFVKPTTNYPNRSTTRFKISTYFDDIVHHLEYHSLLDMFLKIVEFDDSLTTGVVTGPDSGSFTNRTS